MTAQVFSPAIRAAVAARGAAKLLAGLGICAYLMGCSVAIPVAGFSAEDKDDVTGSIAKPASPLSHVLNEEDWRRAYAAMSVALDPQGNGAAVHWDNPESKVKGSFTPVALAYPHEDKICRAFVADVLTPESAQQLQGLGCRDKQGNWDVSGVKPWKKA